MIEQIGREPGYSCPECPAKVPIVANFLAQDVVNRVRVFASDHKYRLLERAFAWLAAPVAGATIYEGINGRPYTAQEKDAIGGETGYVAATGCPFALTNGGCDLGGYCTPAEWQHNTGRRLYLFLPTALAMGLAQGFYRDFVTRHQIADAKIAWLTRNVSLPQTHIWNQNGPLIVPHETGLTWVESPGKVEPDPEVRERQKRVLAQAVE